eukprot:SM000123S25839  [mRNA]  locus=s123:172728:175346:- [translate_table: standard]
MRFSTSAPGLGGSSASRAGVTGCYCTLQAGPTHSGGTHICISIGVDVLLAMNILAPSCPGLRELNLEAEIGPDINVDRPRPWDDCASALALEKLTMTGPTIFSAIPPYHISTRGHPITVPQPNLLHHPPLRLSLQSLECRDCEAEGHDFWDFGTWCPGLTSLVTTSCHERMLARSLAGCSKLVKLEIGDSNDEEYREWPMQTELQLGALRALTCWSVARDDLRMLARLCSGQEAPHETALLDLLSSCTELRTIRIYDVDSMVAGLRFQRGRMSFRLDSVDGEWEVGEEGEWSSRYVFHKYRHFETMFDDEAHSEYKTLALLVGRCSRLVSLYNDTFHWWHYRRIPWAYPPLGYLKALLSHWQDLAALPRASPQLQELEFLILPLCGREGHCRPFSLRAPDLVAPGLCAAHSFLPK